MARHVVPVVARDGIERHYIGVALQRDGILLYQEAPAPPDWSWLCRAREGDELAIAFDREGRPHSTDGLHGTSSLSDLCHSVDVGMRGITIKLLDAVARQLRDQARNE